jgi:hypothetical protein
MPEFLDVLIKNNVKFLFISPYPNMCYKNIFSLYKQNLVWFGYKSCKKFLMPYLTKSEFENDKRLPEKERQYKAVEFDKSIRFGKRHGCYVKKFGNIGWFTNMDVRYRYDEKILSKKYKGNENKYAKYDDNNYIVVDSLKNIPSDYSEPMDVPFTILTELNPKQFKVICMPKFKESGEYHTRHLMGGKPKYNMTVLIKNLNPTKELSEKEEDRL